MRIGVDAGCLGVKDERLKVGVYKVALNLLKELSGIDTKNTYFLYSFYPIDSKITSILGKTMKNIVVTPVRGWMKVWLPVQIAKDKIDLFLGLNQSLPKQMPFTKYFSKIGFVYDLAYEIYPEFYPDSYSRLKSQTQYLVNQSDKIVAISNKTKQDLTNKFSSVKDKIVLAYPGISIKNNSISYKKKNYFLFAGALKRVKNVATLVKAFGEFTKINSEYKLVIAGGDKWFDPEIIIAMESLDKNIQKRIVFKNFVSDDELMNLYKNAAAFVGPSWYEGFGLTFLEAMSYGCPVIGSNSGSVPEVVGDAGILVNPQDVSGLANAMKIMTNENTRNRYIMEGLKQAKKFTWTKFASDIYKIIKIYE